MVKSKVARAGKLIVVAGATATGKTNLSIELALWVQRKFGIGAEIVSADSRQIYRGMDIGTAKATAKEMRGVAHHLIDVADPKRPMWNASRYKAAALRAVAQVHSRGNVPIVVGGSGYWVDAVALGTEFPDAPMDRRLHVAMAKRNLASLVAQLKKLDPVRAAGIDLRNPVRVIRAIEVALYNAQHKATSKKPALQFDVLYLVLDQADDVLKKKIAARLRREVGSGLVREVQQLRERGIGPRKLFTFGLEYRFASEFLSGKISEAEMESRLRLAIWRYVKRQRTWFRRNKSAVWLEPGSKAAVLAQAKGLVEKFLGKS